MRWDEFINQNALDNEARYDGWFIWDENGNFIPINFYIDYRHMMFGLHLGMNNVGNKFEEDETFNIELKCTFPNVILIDDYTRKDEKMKFFCMDCERKFEKTGTLVLNTGCPYCYKRRFKGEELLAKILDEKNIDYVRQESYGCENPKTGHELYYDFIITHGKELIFVEIQGKQHYESIDFFGGEEEYEYRRYKDIIKKEYAEENGIYIALDYSEHNLELLKNRIIKQLLPLIK